MPKQICRIKQPYVYMEKRQLANYVAGLLGEVAAGRLGEDRLLKKLGVARRKFRAEQKGLEAIRARRKREAQQL